MIEKIRNLWISIKDYERIEQESYERKIEIDELNIYNQSLEINYNEIKKDYEECKQENKKLKENINKIDLPKSSLKELEKKLMLADKYTLDIIVNYLTLDSYELVKNIASRVDKNNISEYIAYRDGALGRNEELKRLLIKFTQKDDKFIDRISGEEKTIKNNPK